MGHNKNMEKIKLSWRNVQDKRIHLLVPYNVAWAIARAVAKDQNEQVSLVGKRGEGLVNPDGTAQVMWPSGEVNNYDARTVAAM
jgi:hypothetical protein